MGSYKWVISPLVWVIRIVTILFITTHEPPSKSTGRQAEKLKGSGLPLPSLLNLRRDDLGARGPKGF